MKLDRQTNPLGLVHAIAHALRHCATPERLGRRVVLDGFASLEPRGRMLCDEAEARLLSPVDEQHMQSELAKRGAVLLLLELPPARLPAADPRASFGLLRELGFLGDTEGDREWLRSMTDGDGRDALAELLDEVSGGQPYAKLLLQARPEPLFSHPQRYDIARGKAALPSDYFPRVFELVDACVTNCAMLWTWKYMWL